MKITAFADAGKTKPDKPNFQINQIRLRRTTRAADKPAKSTAG
jgi:hypothetical protein